MVIFELSKNNVKYFFLWKFYVETPLGSPPEHPARWMAVALAMAMFEGGLSDATPIIPAMFQAWAML